MLCITADRWKKLLLQKASGHAVHCATELGVYIIVPANEACHTPVTCHCLYTTETATVNCAMLCQTLQTAAVAKGNQDMNDLSGRVWMHFAAE